MHSLAQRKGCENPAPPHPWESSLEAGAERSLCQGQGQRPELSSAAHITHPALTVHCSPESSNTNALLRLSLSLESKLCLVREFLSIFSRSLTLVSTKPFLQYAAWGMPFLLHSATKFHSSLILRGQQKPQSLSQGTPWPPRSSYSFPLRFPS